MIKQIKWSFLAIIAALSMASCSSDEPGKGQDENDGGDVKYLAVQIVTPTASGSRASQPSNPEFEVGTDTENSVETVRFYFFTSGGDAALVKKKNNDYINFYDWPDNSTDKPIISNGNVSGTPSVSKILNAILVISPENGDKLPNAIVAVVNPDKATLGNDNLDLDALRHITKDFSTYANANQGQSTMFNSVYVDNGAIVSATPLETSNFKKTAEDAEKNPVDIYVERNVAKITAQYNSELKFDITIGEEGDQKQLIKVKKLGENGASPTDLTIDDKQVYINVHGWHVTQELPYSWTSKFLDKQWINTPVFENSDIHWNAPEHKRSYWANSKIPNITNRYPVDWEHHITKHPIGGDPENAIYVNENAARNTNVKATVVIVAATICDQNGIPLTVYEYGGQKHIDNNDLRGLKADFLNYYKGIGHGHVYKEGDQYKEITAEDIEFVQDNGDEVTEGRYYAYPRLTDLAKTKEWYTKKLDPTSTSDNPTYTYTKVDNLTDLNVCLKKQPKALIYLEGRNYYFKEIEHYNKSGIVRNHIYKIFIDGFYGLGTPAYDPDWEIIPERPNPTEAYLAARINILSWHAMTQHVTFQ